MEIQSEKIAIKPTKQIKETVKGDVFFIALADNSSPCMQVCIKLTGSRCVGNQFIFRFAFQLKIFNNSDFMLTCLSAYLRVSRLLMITRLCIDRMDFHDTEIRRVRTRTLSLKSLPCYRLNSLIYQ